MNKRTVKFYKGDFIFREGDASDTMYIIEEGEIAISKNQGGVAVELAQLSKNDLLGEMAFFNNTLRSATAEVTSSIAHLALLPYSALKQEYQSMPTWMKAVIRSINNRLIAANTKIHELEKNSQND